MKRLSRFMTALPITTALVLSPMLVDAEVVAAEWVRAASISSNERDRRIVELTAAYSDPTPPGASATLADVEAAAAVSREVTSLLVESGDLRGVFGVGLDVVERQAVLPYEQESSAWSRAMSANLIYRYLSAVYAEFAGGAAVPVQWREFFDAAGAHAAGDTTLSAAQIAMMGYNAHLTVDLAQAVADSGGRAENYAEYIDIVGYIADTSGDIASATAEAYGIDITALWHATTVVAPVEYGRDQIIRLGDQAYSSLSFTHGLGLADPATTVAAQAQTMQLWGSANAVIRAL